MIDHSDVDWVLFASVLFAFFFFLNPNTTSRTRDKVLLKKSSYDQEARQMKVKGLLLSTSLG